jgi:amino-acid N-acetyltransferase
MAKTKLLARPNPAAFVQWFRAATPYIHAFSGRTFVIGFGGELLQDNQFHALAHDLNLLASLGVRLTLVHGTRPQIDARLRERNLKPRYAQGLRVTDAAALVCVKEAVGAVRVEIESILSMGLANSPMANATIRVASGNFVTARPMGVRQGVDFQHTGEVRKVDADSMATHLERGEIVLLSSLGYSPTGEAFNLAFEDVASHAACALKADKLIFLTDMRALTPAAVEALRELTTDAAQHLFARQKKLSDALKHCVKYALYACRHGVRRAHLIDRHTDGAVLLELFTHDGIGTMITDEKLEDIRRASIEDVGGILSLIEPLESQGILVRRERERLEMEIDHFYVLEHDKAIIGCAALYPFAKEKACELACLAIHPDYRSRGHGETLLKFVLRAAFKQKMRRMFVLTTQTAHWFVERGFTEAPAEKLPTEKRKAYNYQRRSKVFVKELKGPA